MAKLSNKIIKLGEFIYRVYRYTSIDKLELGNAYIFGSKPHKTYGTITYNWVLPYRGEYTEKSSEVGIYTIKKDKTIIAISPISQNDRVLYNVGRIFEITPDNINNEIHEYLKEIDPNELKYSGNIFMPQINTNDDIGVKGIKIAISAKQIDFNAYKGRFDKPHDVTNARKAITTSNTLTFSMLDKYCDKFDIGYGIILFDTRDCKDPMFKKGSPYKAIAIFNAEQCSINDPSIKIVNGIEDVVSHVPEHYEDEEGC